MLELRLRTLAPVADHFCVVACRRTHQGEMADRDQIVDAFSRAFLAAGSAQRGAASLHWVEPNMVGRPEGERGGVGSGWYNKIEADHRNGITNAVRECTQDPQAIVLMSDVDEIPRPAVVEALPLIMPSEWNAVLPIYVFEQRFHSTALELLHPQQPWLGTCAARLAALDTCTPQAIRDARGTLFEQERSLPDGGIHLSWCGTDEERERKLRTFSHAEIAVSGGDPADWRARGVHANGEPLRRLSAEEMLALDWPAPISDGSFVPPTSWHA